MEGSHEDVTFNSILPIPRCDGLPSRRISPSRKSKILGSFGTSSLPSPSNVSGGNAHHHQFNTGYYASSFDNNDISTNSHHSHPTWDRSDVETDGNLSKQELNGLNIAGAALTLISTVFTLFHPMYVVHVTKQSGRELLQVENSMPRTERIEEIFFQEQQASLTLENSNMTTQKSIIIFFVFCIINPTLVFLASWCIDFSSQKKNQKRTDFVQTSGCLCSGTLLLPFLLPSSEWSIMAYDLTYSFINIVIGSAFINGYNMTTSAKVAFLASSEVLYLIISLISCQFGLPHFYRSQNSKWNRKEIGSRLVASNDTTGYDDDYYEAFQNNQQNLGGFSIFLAGVVLLACFLFIIAHKCLRRSSIHSARRKSLEQTDDIETSLQSGSPQLPFPTIPRLSTTSNFFNSIATLQQYSNRTKRNIYQVLFQQKNFRAWISTQLLLKAQNSFISYFLYLLMGRLSVIGQTQQIFHHHLASTTTFSNFSTIFIILISKQIATIAMFVPISIVGYRLTFRYLFDVTLALSVLAFLLGNPTSDIWIACFAFLYTTITRATQAASIYLILSDLILEIRYKSYVLDRCGNDNFHDATFPALLLGINAFFVKPTRTIFAIFAESFSKHLQNSFITNSTSKGDASFTMTDDSKRALFFCIILMTSFCSTLQALSWRRYDLNPRKAAKMREEIQALEQKQRRASTTTQF